MCGICGIVDFRPAAQIEEKLLRRICQTLTHRGPDAEGIKLSPIAALGHRRLSVIDLETGDQPMVSPDGKIWVAFNGEIYNFKVIRESLKKEGCSFKSESDTEVLLHLYGLKREAMLSQLRGMFAFAIWDAENERLLLARDRLGQKPLYYYIKDGLFIFASEIKAILEHPEVSRDVDPYAFDDFLTYSCVREPRTIFKDIHKLPPAHFLSFGRDGARVERYWDVKFDPDTTISFEGAKASVLQHLREAVDLRLISDVPLGAFLSGGIDSGLVVALMSELSSQPVNTFSIGFEEEGWSELPAARMMAERFGTKHREFTVKPEAIEVLPKLIEKFDEPFGDSSAIPTWYLARMTREHVTVALNGDGGDESFGGYPRYLGTLWLERYKQLPQWLRKGPMASLLSIGAGRGRSLARMNRMNQASLEDIEQAYCSFLEIFSPAIKSGLRGAALTRKIGNHESRQYLVELLRAEQGGPETLGRLLYADQRLYLPDDLLVKIDRMTMAHGLEGRSPFLDHKLVEYAATLPASFKVHGRNQKYLLRSLAKDLLPGEIVSRPKQGFAVPVGEWFRKELRKPVERVLENSCWVREGWLKDEAVKKLWHEHLSGETNHSHRLWGILNLELWYRMYIERKQVEWERD